MAWLSRALAQAHRALAAASDAIRDKLAGFDALLLPSTAIRPHNFDQAADMRIAAFCILATSAAFRPSRFPRA